MKKLLCIFLLCNLYVLSSQEGKEYTKDTCNRDYYEGNFLTEEQRENCTECSLSRFELYDKKAEKYVAHIAYKPSVCEIIMYLRVDEEYRKQGIGAELAKKAIADMRANYYCREISLESAAAARAFWEKLGAQPKHYHMYVFCDSLLVRDPAPEDYPSTMF